MIKSLSVSSESSLPPLDDDVDSVCSDELLGSQSRRWLDDLLTGDMAPEPLDASATVGRDGLFVDYHFPLGELEMQPGIKWKRPKVKYRYRLKAVASENTLNVFDPCTHIISQVLLMGRDMLSELSWSLSNI